MQFVRLAYTDDAGTPWDFTLMRPVRPWVPTSVGVGGREFSAARVASSYEVRRDHTLALTLRFTEAEWPALRRALEHGGRSTAITVRLGGVSRSCYLLEPSVDAEITPRRGDYPGDLEIDTVWLPTADVEWDDARVFDSLDLFARAGSLMAARTFSRTSTATQVRETGLIETVAAGILRDRHYVGGERSVLLELARTNVLLWSEDFSNAAWVKSNATIGANAITAPDGTLTADRIIEDTATSTHRAAQTLTGLADNTTATATVFAKARERTWLAIRTRNKANTQNVSFFNLSTGAVGTVGHSAARISALSDGWYRCEVTMSVGSGATTPVIFYELANADNSDSYLGDGSSSLYLWGAQFEASSSFASSYIKTEAATVTRAVDILSRPLPTGASLPTDAWARYTRWMAGTNGGITNARIWQIGNDGGARAFLYWGSATQIILTATNTTSAAILTAAVARGDTVEALAIWNGDGTGTLALCINGGAVTSAAITGTSPGAAWNGGANTYLNSREGGNSAGAMALKDDAIEPGRASGTPSQLMQRFRNRLKVGA